MIYLELFIAFLEVGIFSFGGGYVSIPLIREIVLTYGWMDDEMFTHMVAVSESTPGRQYSGRDSWSADCYTGSCAPCVSDNHIGNGNIQEIYQQQIFSKDA